LGAAKSGLLVQDGRRSDDRVSGEGQFVEQIEDPGADGSRLIRRLEKDRLEVPHLLRDAQQSAQN